MNDKNITEWLKARPEVGVLNGGKYYVHLYKEGSPTIYKEIAVFDMYTGKPTEQTQCKFY